MKSKVNSGISNKLINIFESEYYNKKNYKIINKERILKNNLEKVSRGMTDEFLKKYEQYYEE